MGKAQHWSWETNFSFTEPEQLKKAPSRKICQVSSVKDNLCNIENFSEQHSVTQQNRIYDFLTFRFYGSIHSTVWVNHDQEKYRKKAQINRRGAGKSSGTHIGLAVV